MKKICIYLVAILALLSWQIDATGQTASPQTNWVTISGIVLADNGDNDPLPNVAIRGRNPETKQYINVHTISDADGNFSIKVPANMELVFSFVAFKNYVYKVKNKSASRVFIYMEEKLTALDEVTIGATRKSKVNVASSVVTIDADELAAAPVANAISLLQGRVAGMNIQLNNATPGSMGTVTIRGISNINIVGDGANTFDLQSSMPLFVVDGIPQRDVSNYDSQGLVSGSGVSPLSTVPFEDIERIQILKDAAATSLYGSDGAYGVILIETRKGNSPKPEINYSGNFTVSCPPKLRLRAIGNAERRLRMQQILVEDTSRYHGYNEIMSRPSLSDSLNPYWNNHTDWQGQFYKVTYNQSHNLSINGGNSLLNYKINGNYYTEKGIIRSTDFNRYALSMGLNYRPNDRFSVGVNLNIGFTTNNTGSGNAVSQSGVASGANASSLLPPPSLYTASTDALSVFSVSNENVGSNYSAAINLGYSLPWNIRWSGTFSYGYSGTETEYFSPAILGSEKISENDKDVTLTTYKATSKSLSSTNFNIYGRTTINKSMNLFKLIRLGLTAGVEFRSQKNTGNNIKFFGLPNDYILGPVGYGGSSMTTTVTEDGNTLALIFQPDFGITTSHTFSAGEGDKYIFSPSLRPELNSAYGTKTKWVVNPGLAVRWNIDRENFMQRLKPWISSMNVRASWGRVVKYTASRYDVWGTYDVNPDNRYDNQAYIPINFGKLPNANLEPITTTQWNLGGALGLFNGKVYVDFDTYYKQVDNQLSDVQLPDHSGFTSVKSTEVSLVNYGLEMNFSVNPLPKKWKMKLNCGVNFAINKDFVTKLPNEARQIINDRAGVVNRLGGNATSMFLYINKGVYANDEDVPVNPATGRRLRLGGVNNQEGYFKAGDPIWVDINGDYVIDERDKVIAGNSQPRIQGGGFINLTYGDLSVHTSFSMIFGRDIINANLAETFNTYTNPLLNESSLTGSGALAPISKYNFWTKENRENATYPNPYDYTHASQIKPFRPEQTLWMEDGSYFKINTISLSYRLPKRWLHFLRVRSVALKASLNNVWTFSSYSGISPEKVSGLGYDTSGGYPSPRQWTMGVTIGF